MAKYTVDHACGHTERIELIGPYKTREWRIQQMEREICRDCRAVERQHRNAVAAEENKAADLPALTGTPAQIPWAESIRARQMLALQDALQTTNWQLGGIRDHADLPAAIDALCGRTEARWWIETRDLGLASLIASMLELVRKQVGRQPDEPLGMEAKTEATVRPPDPITETVAEICATSTTVCVSFPERRNDFRELVRELGYRWAETVWRRTIGPFDGSIKDRIAEAGHKLLAAGFPVRIYDGELRAKAVAGAYEPEPKRWVKKRNQGPYAGWFVLVWSRDQDYYAAARRLPGSRYADGNVHVPPEQFEEVLDFAEMHRFLVSPGARELATQAGTLRKSALVAKVPPAPVEPIGPVVSKVPQKLAVPGEVSIDVALRDDFGDDISGEDSPA